MDKITHVASRWYFFFIEKVQININGSTIMVENCQFWMLANLVKLNSNGFFFQNNNWQINATDKSDLKLSEEIANKSIYIVLQFFFFLAWILQLNSVLYIDKSTNSRKWKPSEVNQMQHDAMNDLNINNCNRMRDISTKKGK